MDCISESPVPVSAVPDELVEARMEAADGPANIDDVDPPKKVVVTAEPMIDTIELANELDNELVVDEYID
jgi:hypothetical protein